ncbi:MAG TPA: FAD-dependent oxidoreductase [Actinomycetota bacterium]
MPDVIVVGGGVIGAACAREAARRGMSVTLVERSELAAGASGRNHGLLLTPPDPALVPMFHASRELYVEAADGAAVPFDLDPKPLGFLIVATDDQGERAAGQEEAEAIAASGVPCAELDADSVRSLEPGLVDEVIEGWLLEDGWRLNPSALTVSLALFPGVEVRRHVTVRALLAGGGRVRGVVTDAGTIEADEVIVAAGPWTPALLRPLGVELPIVGARGWLVHLGCDDPPVGRLVERAGWHAVGGEEAMSRLTAKGLIEAVPEPDVGTLVQPNPDGTVLVGGSRQRVVAPEPEDPSVPRELTRRAVDLVPPLGEARVLGSWWGIRPITPDGLPIVARVMDGLVVATGHGSEGVILGGGTGRLVGSMLAGEEPPFDPAPFALR